MELTKDDDARTVATVGGARASGSVGWNPTDTVRVWDRTGGGASAAWFQIPFEILRKPDFFPVTGTRRDWKPSENPTDFVRIFENSKNFIKNWEKIL